jgi:hypothetical protein
MNQDDCKLNGNSMIIKMIINRSKVQWLPSGEREKFLGEGAGASAEVSLEHERFMVPAEISLLDYCTGDITLLWSLCIGLVNICHEANSEDDPVIH